MYQTVQLLATGADWARLDIGRLLALRTLIVRVPDTEEYRIFKAEKETAAREIFAWACGDGLKKPSIAEIRDRVLALVNPEEYAEKQAGKEANAKNDTDSAKKESAEDGKEAPAPDNLIATESRAKPDWKDVPDGMAALFHEGCKQQPGHASDMMRHFAKRFLCTAAMVKGLMVSIADSKDGERTEAIAEEGMERV
jgi:hypothetical protein